MIARLRSIIYRQRIAAVVHGTVISASILTAVLAIDGCVGKPTETKVAQAKVIYHCPMHPNYTSDKPGDCPICGMRLVPIDRQDPTATVGSQTTSQKVDPQPTTAGHGDHAAHATSAPADVPAGLKLGRDQMRLAGINTVEVVEGHLARSIRAVGTVSIDETRVRQVTTKVGGFVEKLYVAATGQMVRAGQPLFALYSPELLASQEEFLRARESAATFERSSLPEVQKGGADLAAAARQRLELFDVPAEFIKSLEETGKVQRDVIFKAPFGGFVTGKNVVAGQRIEPGMDLLTVTDLSHVWVIAQVYEAEAALAQPGRLAAITLPYDPSVKLTGRVDFVYPTLDAESRTLKVRLELPNARGALKPGMFVNVELAAAEQHGAVVPDGAVMNAGPRQVVFVETAPGEFATRDVVVSMRQDGQTLIRSGLRPGERVAAAANFLLDSESRLRGAMPGEKHQH